MSAGTSQKLARSGVVMGTVVLLNISKIHRCGGPISPRKLGFCYLSETFNSVGNIKFRRKHLIPSETLKSRKAENSKSAGNFKITVGNLHPRHCPSARGKWSGGRHSASVEHNKNLPVRRADFPPKTWILLLEVNLR